MKLTERDLQLIKDIALSHVLSRDQIIELGYFSSVTRLNSRIRFLVGERLLVPCETPFFNQRMYIAGPAARQVVGEKIATMISGRPASPRFVQHCLAVNQTRIRLLGQGLTDWRFEAQISPSFSWNGLRLQIKPDGMVRQDGRMVLLEIDLGHVNPSKFGLKLKTYRAFVESGSMGRVWGTLELTVHTITVGTLRKAHLTKLQPSGKSVIFKFSTFDELGVELAGGWS